MSEVDTSQNLSEAQVPVATPSDGRVVDVPGSTPDPVDTTVQPDPAPDPEKEKQAQSRREARAFASLRRQNNEKEREIGRLQGLIEAKSATTTQQKAGPPKQSDYNSFDDWLAAVVVQAGDSAVEKVSKATRERDGGDDVERKNREAGKAFWEAAAKEAKDKGIEGIAEAEEAIVNGEVETNAVMGHYVMKVADNKAALVVWLTDNPDESARIAKLDPVSAGAALAKVDSSLGKKPAPVSKAPAPVPQPTGGGTASQSIERMDFDALTKLVGKWNRS